MSEATGNGGDVNLIGMARLSCLPCRRRKSKCDRVQPCSSCVLRKTERFCYSLEAEKDASLTAARPKRAENTSSSPTDAISPSSKSGSKDVSIQNRQLKKQRKESGDSAGGASALRSGSSGVVTGSTLDQEDVQRTIAAMETTIEQLKRTIGLSDERTQRRGKEHIADIVHWSDVAHLLPSQDICELVLDYFFSDTHWQSSYVHEGMFKKQWTRLVEGASVSRIFISLFCAMVAQSLLFAPAYHPLSKVSIANEHRNFCILAHQLMDNPSDNILDDVEPTIEESQARAALLTYMSFAGASGPTWIETGRTIRINKTLSLYDEDHWPKRELSDWDMELRRRLAWEVAMSDRWMSLYYQGVPDLPGAIRVERPQHYADECYDAETGRLDTNALRLHSTYPFSRAKWVVSDAAFRVNEYLQSMRHMSRADRYQKARDVAAVVTRALEEDTPALLKYDIACRAENLQHRESARIAAQSLILYTSTHRLLCLVMRYFLLDHEAPIDLRIAALEHARKIIETTSLIVTISSSPFISFNCAWCSGHLFCAASTFAIVYLEEREQDLQDMNWFASKIFDVIETLSFLSTKDLLAKRCEELLTALCTSKDWLRKRFLDSRLGKMSSMTNKGSSTSARTSTGDFAHEQRMQKARAGNAAGIDDVLGESVKGGAMHPNRGILLSSAAYPEREMSDISRLVEESPKSTAGETGTVLPGGNSPVKTAMLSNQPQDEAWMNWPVLDEQQWSSLLNSLEQDMTALTEGTQPVQSV